MGGSARCLPLPLLQPEQLEVIVTHTKHIDRAPEPPKRKQAETETPAASDLAVVPEAAAEATATQSPQHPSSPTPTPTLEAAAKPVVVAPPDTWSTVSVAGTEPGAADMDVDPAAELDAIDARTASVEMSIKREEAPGVDSPSPMYTSALGDSVSVCVCV